MATAEVVSLNESHKPRQNAFEAFHHVQHKIKAEIVKSRHLWDEHEPKMWARAAGLSDHQLTDFKLEQDLVEIRSGAVSYGTVIFGKIRIPAVKDDKGEGFVHVRIHDPPNRGEDDVVFHSIRHIEGQPDKDGHHYWCAVQPDDTPLEFFSS